MDNAIYNPFSGEDEMIIKDSDGRLKVLRGNTFIEIDEGKNVAPTVSPSPSVATSNQPQEVVDHFPGVVMDTAAEPLSGGISVPPSYDDIIDSIISGIQLSFEDEVMEKRFRNLMLSRLKEIRSSIEVEEILGRPSKVGGMGFDKKKSELIMKSAEKFIKNIGHGMRDILAQKREEMHTNINSLVKAKNEPPIITFDNKTTFPPLPESMKKIRKDDLSALPKNDPTKNTVIDAVSNVDKKLRVEKKISNILEPKPHEEIQKLLEDTKEKLLEAKNPIPEKNTAEVLNKTFAKPIVTPKSVETVKIEPQKIPSQKPQIFETPKKEKKKFGSSFFKPKLTGPVDEFSTMTIVDFRRLSPDPKEATKKILEKVKLLEEENFDNRIAAIHGWRQSEVFRVYTEMGRESMNKKISIKQIGEMRMNSNLPNLTQAELEAVMDLNQKMRF